MPGAVPLSKHQQGMLSGRGDAQAFGHDYYRFSRDPGEG